MDIVLLSGLFGAAAGALGFFIAKKIHGPDLVERCYPPYSLAFFGMFHMFFFLLR